MSASTSSCFHGLSRHWKTTALVGAALAAIVLFRFGAHPAASSDVIRQKSSPTQTGETSGQQLAFAQSYQSWRAALVAISQDERRDGSDLLSEMPAWVPGSCAAKIASGERNRVNFDPSRDWPDLCNDYSSSEPVQRRAKLLEIAAAARLKAIQDADISDAQKGMLRNREIWIGASPEFARLSWGNPQKINRTTDANAVHEQWVYGESSYLYFDNDKLTSIQDSN